MNNGPILFPLAQAGPPVNRLLGANDFDFGTFVAGKLDGGFWFNRCHTLGVYYGGLITEQRAITDFLISDAAGVPPISRPFINALDGQSAALVVAQPGFALGGFSMRADSQLFGAEFGGLRNLFQCDNYTVNLRAGYRFLDLDENLELSQVTQRLDGQPIPYGRLPESTAGQSAGTILIQDRFHTRNSIFAGSIGFDGEYRWGRLVTSLKSIVSLGTNHQSVENIGQTSALDGSGSVSGGLLALPGIPARLTPPVPAIPNANFGRNSINRFVIVPEVGVKLGWQATQALRFTVGYDFIYVNDVARPGTQVDAVVNQRYVPVSPVYGTTAGPASPTFTYRSETFYAQGVNLGVELRY